MAVRKSDIKIIRSARKTLCLQITKDLEIIVRAPYGTSDRACFDFVKKKQQWLDDHLKSVAEARARYAPKQLLTEEEIRALADEALVDIAARVRRFAPVIGVTYGRITIRNQKSRWGSCSSRGNLNFNCLLMLTPPEVRDYVVIHELCHRKEMNHSPRFWDEVARYDPLYREHLTWLKTEGRSVMRRMTG